MTEERGDLILYGQTEARRVRNRHREALWSLPADLDLKQLLLPDYCRHGVGENQWIGSNLSWMAKVSMLPCSWLSQLPFDEESETYGEPINDDWATMLDRLDTEATYSRSDRITAGADIQAAGHQLDLIRLQVDGPDVDARANSFPLQTRAAVHQIKAIEQLVGTGDWRHLFWEQDHDTYNLLLLYDQAQQVKGMLLMF